MPHLVESGRRYCVCAESTKMATMQQWKESRYSSIYLWVMKNRSCGNHAVFLPRFSPSHWLLIQARTCEIIFLLSILSRHFLKTAWFLQSNIDCHSWLPARHENSNLILFNISPLTWISKEKDSRRLIVLLVLQLWLTFSRRHKALQLNTFIWLTKIRGWG